MYKTFKFNLFKPYLEAVIFFFEAKKKKKKGKCNTSVIKYRYLKITFFITFHTTEN